MPEDDERYMLKLSQVEQLACAGDGPLPVGIHLAGFAIRRITTCKPRGEAATRQACPWHVQNLYLWLPYVLLHEHKKWVAELQCEHHFAHRSGQDGRHSPQEVLRGVLGRTYPETILARVLYATQKRRQYPAK
jgi:hypothetical protein